MIQRKYNLNLTLAIGLGAVVLAIVLGALQKQYGILDGANAFAIQIAKSLRAFPSLTVVMAVVTWFGGALGIMVFISIIFWLGYTAEMITFLLLVVFGTVLSDHMKEFFALNRPLSSEITTITRAKGYGYPSGHSQTGVYYSWILYAFLRKYWYLCLIPALLLAASRIYLGVHYFSDTIGGLLIGLGLAVGATGIYGHIRELSSLRESIRNSPVLRMVLSLALSTAYLLFAWGQPDSYKYGGFLAGFFIVYSGLGFRWRSRNPFFSIIVIIVGLVCLFGIQIGLELTLPENNFSSYCTYFILGIVLAISPLIFVKIRLLKRVAEALPAEEPSEAEQEKVEETPSPKM